MLTLLSAHSSMFCTILTPRALWLGSAAMAAFSIILLQRSRRYRLPPSPPGDPIIGHARVVPLEFAWETFYSWKKLFGEIILKIEMRKKLRYINVM